MNNLNNCPRCGGNDLEEDWDSLWEATYDSQNGFIDCQDCGFGISLACSTERIEYDKFVETLHSLWNNIQINS